VLGVLADLAEHKDVLEYAKWKMDNGAEAVVFKGILKKIADESSEDSSAAACQVELIPLHRNQKVVLTGYVYCNMPRISSGRLTQG
jgi:hypothetical protein